MNGNYFLSRPVAGSFFAQARCVVKNFMELVETGFGRKLDSSGRLVVPIRLREKLCMDVGNYYKFFVGEQDGKTYLCIECPENQSELQKAFEVLKKNGYEIEES